MAHNETRNGLNETERVPRTWSRSTVADGQWMQKNTLGPYRNSDWFLASAIDNLLDKDDELTQAIADEATARQQNDSDLSAWCTRLTNSAEDLYTGLSDEIAARQAAIEAEQQARTQGDADTLASAKEYANNASAYALAEAKTYTNTASSYLDGRIDGVSSTFNSFSADLKLWKGSVETWSAGINTWKDNTDNSLSGLQGQIDAIEKATDVIDVVNTTAGLNPYYQGTVTSGDIIKVLSGTNGEQDYYKWTGTGKKKTNPPFSEFTLVGSLSPYYSKSETYSRSELYTQSQVDAKLADKLDTSAEHIYQYLAVEIPGQTGKYVTVLNNMEILADHALYDYQGNAIHETYLKQSALSDYATKTYVNGTFASANNVYAKNQTSGKDQLNIAFGNKLDASAAFEGHIKYNHRGGSPDVYDLGDLWYEYGFDTPPEETKVNNDQGDVIVYAYPKDDQAYSARRYIGCFKRRKEIELYNNVLQAWPNKTILPDFEHYPNTFFII